MPEPNSAMRHEKVRQKVLKNTMWNISGQVVPALTALFTIPILIGQIGNDKFGILTIAWMFLGYFSLFDFGIGRALTKLVAEKISQEKSHELPEFIWTALLLLLALGIIGSLVFFFLSPLAINSVLNIPSALKKEALTTFYVISFSVPLIIINTALRGILEAYQRFDLINYVNIFLGCLTYIGPVALLSITSNLSWIVTLLLFFRVLSCIFYCIIIIRLSPTITDNLAIKLNLMKSLISYGSWLTISNIISPIMVSFDRFIIGSLLTITAVTYYSTPFDMVMRLLILSSAFSNVLFPLFAGSFHSDREGVVTLFTDGLRNMLLVFFPITIAIILFSHRGLTLWLGARFADNSYYVLNWLALGVFLNSIARIPFSLIQASGRSDLTAKIHLVELPIYVPVLIVLIKLYGIQGAAVAWVVRACLDLSLLLYTAKQNLALTRNSTFNSFLAACLIALLLMITSCLNENLSTKLILTAASLLAYIFYAMHNRQRVLPSAI